MLLLFREDLMNIARTTLSSKILSQHKDFFSNLAVDAVLRLVLRVFFREKYCLCFKGRFCFNFFSDIHIQYILYPNEIYFKNI